MELLTPQIKQYFDPKLLSTPFPKMNEGCHTLWAFYKWINERYERKKKGYSEKKRIVIEKNLKEFLEIYERTKKKE